MPSGQPAFRSCNLCGEGGDLAFVFQVGRYSIVRCRRCGLVYTNELPSRAELDEVYSSHFFEVGAKFDTACATSPGLVNARRRLERLLRLPDVGVASWLDVGCATGDFLVAAKTAVSVPCGVEISGHAAAVARSRGLQVLSRDLLEVESRPGRFDVVTMWDYIEHVRDPMTNVAKARDLLRDGGYIAISTGDVESGAARVMRRRWHLMIPPRHLYFFSERTLSELLRKNGFSVVTIGRNGKRVPLDFIAWKAAFLWAPSLARPVARAAQRLGLGRIAPTLNLGDVMTVVARTV